MIRNYLQMLLKQAFHKTSIQPNTTIKPEKFVFADISAYYQLLKVPNFQKISDKTFEDLDLEEVFMLLDRTNSKVGQQYFYQQLRTIYNDKSVAEKHQDITHYFQLNSNAKKEVNQALLNLDHLTAFEIHSLFQKPLPTSPDWILWAYALGFFGITSLISTFFYPIISVLFVVVFAINLFIHLKNKREMDEFTTSFNQLLPLIQISSLIYKKHPITNKLQPELNDSINQLNSLKKYLAWYNAEQKLQGDFAVIFELFTEFIKIIGLLNPIIHYRFIEKLRGKTQSIHTLFSFVGQVDMLQSLAQVKKEFSSCTPNSNTNASLKFEDVYHPLLHHSYVANNIDTQHKSVLITGSNMSGKTTFMRTIGLNSILAQTINLCFAKSANVPPIKVFSAMRISDDLLNSKSYYQQEVDYLKAFIDQAEKPSTCLFLLDEIYKGTNTQERIAAGYAVLYELANNQNIVFVATHDVELTQLLQPSYALYHFSEQVHENSLGFDYRLKNGPNTSQNAIKILEISGYPSRVIEMAKAAL